MFTRPSATGNAPKGHVSVSLIMAVYRRADFLALVLTSIERQSHRDMEVIIAEDDQSEAIRELIDRRKKGFPFPVRHVCQEDRGFRKNKILNKAVLASEGSLLVFIDGDCVLHPRFVEAHVKAHEPDTCVFGRRAMLSGRLTKKLLYTANFPPSAFSILFSRTGHPEDGLYIPWITSGRKCGIKGCNFSLGRELLYRINGFDEDFEKPFGGEDDDIERRLRLIDTKFKCSKFKTVQYHLHHGGREGRKAAWENEGATFYQKKVAEGLSFCINGLFPER